MEKTVAVMNPAPSEIFAAVDKSLDEAGDISENKDVYEK